MNKSFNFNLIMLSKELDEGEMLTTIEHVSVGQAFRKDGQTYIKCHPCQGHKYNPTIHQEELVTYNCYTLVAGEYKVYANFMHNEPCIVREEQ